jgi:hypothetical protein
MKPHRTDGLSLTFGLIFLAVVAWWLFGAQFDIALPSGGWFVAGALILFGVVGLLGALRPDRSKERRKDRAATESPVLEYATPAYSTSGAGAFASDYTGSGYAASGYTGSGYAAPPAPSATADPDLPDLDDATPAREGAGSTGREPDTEDTPRPETDTGPESDTRPESDKPDTRPSGS